MDSTDRSKQGGVDDAKQSASALNFDASSLSSDGTTLKISHDDNAPKPTPEPEPAPQPAPEHVASEPVSSSEPRPLDHPTQPIPPAQPTGVPVNPLARKAPTFIGNSQASRTAQFAQQTGDIMLQPTQPPKKSKKPLIVGGIILGILVVGVVIFLIFTSLKTNQQAAQKLQLMPAFNRYANYILYNKDSDESLTGEFSNKENYYITKAIYNTGPNGDKRPLNTAEQKFNDFMNSFNQTKIQDDELTNTVRDYKNHFDFIKLYAVSEPLSSDMILNKYLEGSSYDQISSYINKSYDPFIQSSSEVAKKYAENSIKQLGITNSLYNEMNSAGCFRADKTIDDNCVNSIMSNFNFSQNNATNIEEPTTIISNSTQIILKGCWTINQKLGGQQ